MSYSDIQSLAADRIIEVLLSKIISIFVGNNKFYFSSFFNSDLFLDLSCKSCGQLFPKKDHLGPKLQHAALVYMTVINLYFNVRRGIKAEKWLVGWKIVRLIRV